jgi:hypothetical protein
MSAVQDAANDLIAAFPNTPHAKVLAFQVAYNQAKGASMIAEDGAWGPDTATALQEYGTVPGSMLSSQMYTWTDEDVAALIAFCKAMGITDLSVPIKVWSSESGLDPRAHNANGNASGIFQLMPDTAKGLGWNVSSDPQLDKYRQLSAAQQINPWATKFYGSKKQYIGNTAGMYVATFLPAYVSQSGNPSYILARKGDANGWYKANAGFDTTGKGTITVADITAKAEGAYNMRARALYARAQAMAGGSTPTPSPTPSGGNANSSAGVASNQSSFLDSFKAEAEKLANAASGYTGKTATDISGFFNGDEDFGGETPPPTRSGPVQTIPEITIIGNPTPPPGNFWLGVFVVGGIFGILSMVFKPRTIRVHDEAGRELA